MPAFFILSGMCFRPKDSEFDLCRAIKKKAKGLVWPYITFSIIGVILYWLLLADTSKGIDCTFTQTICGIVWNDGIHGIIVTKGFWFIYDLIWITFIHILTRRIFRPIRFVLATLTFFILSMLHWNFYFSAEIIRIAAGYMFFLIGDMFVANGVEKMLSMNKCKKVIGGGIFAFPFHWCSCSSLLS